MAKNEIRKGKDIRYQEGDAIEGERIAYECRKLVQKGLMKGSGRHNAQYGMLERNAFCVIDRKFENIPQK